VIAGATWLSMLIPVSFSALASAFAIVLMNGLVDPGRTSAQGLADVRCAAGRRA
jgi:hypothetical protein